MENSFSNDNLNNNILKLKKQFDDASEDIKLDLMIKL